MNKRTQIIIAVISSILGISLLGGIYYFSQFKTVTINSSPDITRISLSNKEGKLIKEIATPTNLSLKKEKYTLTTYGPKIISKTILLDVNTTNNLTLDADYSIDYLADILNKERSDILSMISHTYPLIKSDNYNVATIRLYKKGDIGGVVIIPRDYDIQNPANIYRLVIKKQNNHWQSVGIPQLVLTAHNTPDIPKDILKKINVLIPQS